MRFLALASALVSTLLTACAPVVSSIAIEEPLLTWPSGPFPASLTVEPMVIRDGGFLSGDPEKRREQFEGSGLVRVLRDPQVFARTTFGIGEEASTALILRGEIVGRWNPRGRENFLTWWPGGLILKPNWHGTRMEYFTEARLELVDRRTGEQLATYRASTAHEVVHKSATPGPFFGAAIIVPNVAKGAGLDHPREVYKNLVYPIAHTRLWEEIASQIVNERTPVYASAAEAQRRRCGAQLDLQPRVGQQWSEFIGCQSAYYELEAQVGLAEGAASVFVAPLSGSKVAVVNGEIVRWENPVSMPSISAPPPISPR
jgi:hypothetical protein